MKVVQLSTVLCGLPVRPLLQRRREKQQLRIKVDKYVKYELNAQIVGKFINMIRTRLRYICEHVLWFCGFTSGDIWWPIRRQSEGVEHAHSTFHSLDVVISSLDFALRQTIRMTLTEEVHDLCGLLSPHSRRYLPPTYPH